MRALGKRLAALERSLKPAETVTIRVSYCVEPDDGRTAWEHGADVARWPVHVSRTITLGGR